MNEDTFNADDLVAVTEVGPCPVCGRQTVKTDGGGTRCLYCAGDHQVSAMSKQAGDRDGVLDALKGLVAAITTEVNEKGAGGFLLARLSDARDAIAKADAAASATPETHWQCPVCTGWNEVGVTACAWSHDGIDRTAITVPDTRRAALLQVLAEMPDEAFGWFVAWAAGGMMQYPDGLGGFRSESRASIEQLRAAGKARLELGE